MTDGQPKDRSDVSSSTASASTYAEKRKEYNKRYYASRKEKNKLLKVCAGDISQSDLSIEGIPHRTLQTNGCQMTQMPKANVSRALAEKREERYKRYYALHEEDNKLLKVGTGNISQSGSSMEGIPQKSLQTNSVQTTQMPKEDVSHTSAEKREERYKRYYALHEEDSKVLKVGAGDISQSGSSIERTPQKTSQTDSVQMTQMPKENVSLTSAEKRKEYHKQYYALRKENNNVLKGCSGDISQSDLSTEGIPQRTLQTNSSQMTQMPKENVLRTSAEKQKEMNKRYYAYMSQIRSSVQGIPQRTLQNNSIQMTQMPKVKVLLTSAEKRKERNRRYYARCKEIAKRISNRSQIAQPPTDDNTPTTTLPSVIDTVKPGTSEGTKMINSEINTTELGANVAGPTTGHKKPVLASKKVVLRDVQNDNSNFTRNVHSQNLIPVEGQLFTDACKTTGTKRLAPDHASSPVLTKNVTHEQLNCPGRKYELEGNKEKNAGHPKSGSLTQIQQEAGHVSGKNVQYGSVVGTNQMVSKPYVSRFKESNDEQWADRFICLQNYIKQCDASDHRKDVQLLMRLSPPELSKRAVELEKRAIQLTMEEGKEMQRMQALNILGKPSLTRNPIPITEQKN